MKGASFLLIALLLPWNLHASGEVEQRLPEMLFSETHLQALEAYDSAVFAGGCFWCLEKPFEELVGVAEAVSGYSGGDEKDPRYQDVASGRTGHRESVTVYYNSEVITYRQLLDVFWRNIDPTDGGGQFADRGSQYAPAIFVGTRGEREAAEASKKQLEASGTFSRPILVEILDRRPFYPAEEYHQDYYKKTGRPTTVIIQAREEVLSSIPSGTRQKPPAVWPQRRDGGVILTSKKGFRRSPISNTASPRRERRNPPLQTNSGIIKRRASMSISSAENPFSAPRTPFHREQAGPVSSDR